MSIQKVNKDRLKEAVDNQLETIAPNNEIIISGVRAVKGGKLELEFVQARMMNSSQPNVIQLLNKHDERFNVNGKRVLRAWMSTELESIKEAFKQDFSEIAKLAESLQPDERVMVMLPVSSIHVNGVVNRLSIKVVQAVDATKIKNKSVRESIINQDEYSERYELKGVNNETKELENIVDEQGNAVFHYTELVYGDPNEPAIEDELIPNKQILSRFISDMGKDKSKGFIKSLIPESAKVNNPESSTIPLTI